MSRKDDAYHKSVRNIGFMAKTMGRLFGYKVADAMRGHHGVWATRYIPKYWAYNDDGTVSRL